MSIQYTLPGFEPTTLLTGTKTQNESSVNHSKMSKIMALAVRYNKHVVLELSLLLHKFRLNPNYVNTWQRSCIQGMEDFIKRK